ncbi:hypothetical protein BDW75DRAFT_250499 [Aspergillus navahoensis]
MTAPNLPCSHCRGDKQRPKCGRCHSRNLECIPVERKAVFRRGRVSKEHDVHENTFAADQTWVNSQPKKWRGTEPAAETAQLNSNPSPGRPNLNQSSVVSEESEGQPWLEPSLVHPPVQGGVGGGDTGAVAHTQDLGLGSAILPRATADGFASLMRLDALVSAAAGIQTQHTFPVPVQGGSNGITASHASSCSITDNPTLPSLYQPLASLEESCLLRYFIEELSPWFDHCDPQSHFRQVIPLRAQTSRYPSLLNAIFAVSARHLSRLPQYKTREGYIKYHGQTLPDLSTSSAVEYMLKCIPGLSSFHDISDSTEQENLMCAAIILRQYEEMEEEMEEMETEIIPITTESNADSGNAGEGGESPRQGRVNFLAITQTIVHTMISTSSPLQRSPLAVTAYWIAIRQEVYYALTRKRVPCLAFPAQVWESATVANRMIMHAGEVTGWCWGDKSFSEYERLRRHQEQLVTTHSCYLTPILEKPADRSKGEIFPTIWYATDAQVTGVQHLEMARMILIAENPRLLGKGVPRSMHRKTESLVRNIVLKLCGIAVDDVAKRMPALVNAVASILLYGEYFTDQVERDALLGVIERMKDMRAWPLKRGVERLERAWREADNVESLAKIVTRYKALRLTALQRSPEAFTSTYAREAQFDDETWTSRVVNPLATILIALSPDPTSKDINMGSDDDETLLIGRPWLGQLTLLGPVLFPANDEKAKRAPWELFKNINFEQAAKGFIPVGSNVVYILVGMYVLPEARGAGNGQRLLEAATRAVDNESKKNKVNALVIILVARENETAKRLYERVGFVAWEEVVDFEGEKHWALSLRLVVEE